MENRGPSSGAEAEARPSGAASLYVASFKNMLPRAFTMMVVAVASLPVLPPAYAVGWVAAWFPMLAMETLVARQAAARPEAIRAWQMLLPAFLASGHFAAAAVGFWFSGSDVGQLFAFAIVCTTLMYLLMQYYARPKFFYVMASPHLALLVVAVGHLSFTHFRTDATWGGLTAALTALMLLHFVINTRRQLARSRAQLREARSRAQHQTEVAETANAAKSAFLAIMSHEIRTPLNGVLGMAQAMAADTLTPIQRDRLDVVRQSGETLLAILNDVLDLSKIEAGKLQLEQVAFDLEEIARGAHAAFTAIANKQGLSFDLIVQPEAKGGYLGDPTRVRQILYNLLSNALKFTKAGEVRALLSTHAGVLRIQVRDTGCGIASAQLEQLFKPFVQADSSTTRKFGGTGLGLSICRDLVRLMGGEITVDSAVGVGSVFTVELPLPRADVAEPAQAAPVEEAAEALPALRVLAAEDNTVNQLVLRTLLHQVGVEPVIVGDGAQAVEAWRQQSWDMILMDVQMPVLDGPGAARAIRAEEAATGRPRTPILALTANAMGHQIAEYFEAGMDGHIAKPIEAMKLYEALQSAPAPAELEDAA